VPDVDARLVVLRRRPGARRLWAVAVLIASTALVTNHQAGAAVAPGLTGVVGVFVDESGRVPFVPEADTVATDAELVDVEADGDLDLFVTRGDLAGGARANQLFLNDGSGHFSLAVGAAGPVAADFNDAAFADLSGDGRPDAVLAVTLGPVRLITRHPVHPRFLDKSDKLPANQPADVTIESRLFDADGDGDLDIITAVENPFGAGAQDRLYLNAGKARFVDATANLPVMSVQASSSAVGDFDGDADADVIVVNNGPFSYLENDGTGHFVDGTGAHLPFQAPDRQSGRDAVVGDLDGDGDLDAMFAMSRANLGPMLWLNNGKGVFTDVSDGNVPLAARAAQDLELCDLDADGDLDVIEANTGAVLAPATDHRFVGARERLLINDGHAVYSDVSDGQLVEAAVDASFASTCGDIDGDGDADIIVANGKGERMRVYVQTMATTGPTPA
jgi:hypothetical protein